MYQQYQDGKKAEADGKTEYSVEDADQAIINAKKEKEQADQNDKEGAPQEEAGEKHPVTMRIITHRMQKTAKRKAQSRLSCN